MASSPRFMFAPGGAVPPAAATPARPIPTPMREPGEAAAPLPATRAKSPAGDTINPQTKYLVAFGALTTAAVGTAMTYCPIAIVAGAGAPVAVVGAAIGLTTAAYQVAFDFAPSLTPAVRWVGAAATGVAAICSYQWGRTFGVTEALGHHAGGVVAAIGFGAAAYAVVRHAFKHNVPLKDTVATAAIGALIGWTGLYLNVLHDYGNPPPPAPVISAPAPTPTPSAGPTATPTPSPAPSSVPTTLPSAEPTPTPIRLPSLENSYAGHLTGETRIVGVFDSISHPGHHYINPVLATNRAICVYKDYDRIHMGVPKAYIAFQIGDDTFRAYVPKAVLSPEPPSPSPQGAPRSRVTSTVCRL
jgi:hypothetical protein